MRKKIVKLFLFFLLLCIAGCITEYDEQGRKTVRLDPNAAETIEKGAEGTSAVLTILSAIWPGLIPVATLAVGIAGAVKKLKPKLVEAQRREKMYYNITKSGVLTIEEFKKAMPDLWDRMEKKYWSGVIGPEAENVIRALRGLPEKSTNGG